MLAFGSANIKFNEMITEQGTVFRVSTYFALRSTFVARADPRSHTRHAPRRAQKRRKIAKSAHTDGPRTHRKQQLTSDGSLPSSARSGGESWRVLQPIDDRQRMPQKMGARHMCPIAFDQNRTIFPAADGWTRRGQLVETLTTYPTIAVPHAHPCIGPSKAFDVTRRQYAPVPLTARPALILNCPP